MAPTAPLLPMVFTCLLDRWAPDIDARPRGMPGAGAPGPADRLIHALARRHLEAHDEVEGIFTFDGRTRWLPRRGRALVCRDGARPVVDGSRHRCPDARPPRRWGLGVDHASGHARRTACRDHDDPRPRRPRCAPHRLLRTWRLVPQAARRAHDGRIRRRGVQQRTGVGRARCRVRMPPVRRRERMQPRLPARRPRGPRRLPRRPPALRVPADHATSTHDPVIRRRSSPPDATRTRPPSPTPCPISGAMNSSSTACALASTASTPATATTGACTMP